MITNFFGKGATAPAQTSTVEKQNLSSKLNLTDDLSPEAAVTSPNFVLVDGLLQGIVEVTPQMAEEWLKRSNNVRKLQTPTVLLYAECMSNDEWDSNGETLKFNPDGDLIDGQHRLSACFLSGKSFVTGVVWGVKSAINIDRGKARMAGQIIHAEGFSIDPNRMAAAVSYLHSYEDEGSKGFVTVGHGKHPLTMDRRLEFAKANSNSLNHSLSETDKSRKLFNKPSLHVALHFLFSKVAGEALADGFYDKLQSGAGLTSDDPIYHLRERLLKEKSAKKQPQINPYAGVIIKAWNFWIAGKRVQSFRYKFEVDGVPNIKRSALSK